jgi:hypothetical protein
MAAPVLAAVIFHHLGQRRLSPGVRRFIVSTLGALVFLAYWVLTRNMQ